MRTLFSLLLCIISAGLPTTHATGKPLELNYSIFFPATHGHTLLATEWAREVEKRTHGAVKINIFVGATLILEGHPFTVVGVTPSGFFGETLQADPRFKKLLSRVS